MLYSLRPLSPTTETIPPVDKSNDSCERRKAVSSPCPATPIRRVHFSLANAEADSQVGPHKELELDMMTDLWYSGNDISDFKQEARTLIRQSFECSNNSMDREALVGLERYNPKRSEFKRLSILFTLKAQAASKNPDIIRPIAQRCNAWARAVAMNQGVEDYCAVYDPLASLLDFDGCDGGFDDLYLQVPDQDYQSSRKRDRREGTHSSHSKRRRLSLNE